MSDYIPPLKDINFVLEHIAGAHELAGLDRFSESFDASMVEPVLEEVGRFMAEVVAPTNVDGDTTMSKWVDGEVITPDSFKAAYKQYVATGFGSIPFDPTYGGGGFPWTVGVAIQELLTSSNMAFSLCPLLTQGAIDAIEHHADDKMKSAYLPKMLTGQWSGTMNLSEPQAGSDVGAVATKAEPVGDGSYKITGQKIWITFGDHDMAENIVHLVLARTPGAPPGTKGITMFMVPKYLLDGQGNPGEKNDVACVSIEHKLGIHGSPTCVLSFGDNGGAIGWPIGDEFTGMRNMFTMMNNARLSVGLQGLALAERAYQGSLAYAQERRQGTAVGAKRGVQSPIIEHADVRRLLMSQRSWIDAMRCLIYTNAASIDRSKALSGEEGEQAREMADLLIPLSKSLCTDLGNELTSLAMQVFGGMGYVEETGAAQHYRDIRIGAIYEGTNGIQAADLVGRKLPMRGGGVVMDHLAALDLKAKELASQEGMAVFAENLETAVATARDATSWLLEHGATDVNAALAGSSPYLRMLGTVVCGGLMADLAMKADKSSDAEFAEAKKVSARFFGEQILPTANGLLGAVTAGPDDLFALTPKQLA
ncbi:MAG: acyl-CoA dehydrogenase [Acidimicrobiales bacterium]|nr:acyl-CoA dehydrogenase [Acidimicrobiales bacterium]